MMKRFFALHLTPLLLAALLFAGSANAQKYKFEGTVTKAPDADMLVVRDKMNIDMLIRLAYIDCPDAGQPFYSDARKLVRQYALEKDVKLDCDSVDMYGRTFCQVELPDGRNLNKELLRFGFAWHYTRYSDDEELAELEATAKANKAGIWQYDNPTPPWEYRRDDTVTVAQYEGTFLSMPENPNDPKKERIKVGVDKSPRPLDAYSDSRIVFICTDEADPYFHRKDGCTGANVCKRYGSLQKVSHTKAVKYYDRRACRKCW